MVLFISDTLNWITHNLFADDITSLWNWLTGGTVLATIVGSFFLVLKNRKNCKQLESELIFSIPIGVNIENLKKCYKK